MKLGLYFLLVSLVALTNVAGVEQSSSAVGKLRRIPDTRYELHGVAREYIAAITENWLLTMPDRNPAILQMFADRDKQPHRNLLRWSGEFAGKYLTGATQVLRLTHDPKLKDYLTKFVANLVRLQAEDGYLGPFPSINRLEGKGGTWDAWGHYHIMLGLLLWHEETGDPQTLQCAVKIGDLLCQKFLHAGKRIVDTGSAETNHSVIHSLCLLYKVTKTPAYLELARQIADEEFPAKGAGDYVRVALAGREFYQGPKPRWESLHSIQGIVELYWITGDEHYRKAFEQLWWSIAKLDRHNNGGFSSGEQARGNPYHQGAIETCCTVAWIAMGVDMLRLTGNSVVADELELSTLNQVLGYQHRSGKWCTYNTPMDGLRGNSMKQIAFQIRPGSEEINCCSANAPRGFGMISDWALMTDGQGLVLNWYGPSALSAMLNGTAVAIKQQTDYPRDGRIVLNVSPERDMRFPLKLRIPHWSATSRVQVNGQPVRDVKPGAYLVLDREWKPGDTVQVDLDMSLHYWAGERECAGTTSIYRGPLLLVYELDRQWPALNPAIHFSAGWKHLGHSSVTKVIGASLEASFEG
ncbi:MAG: glycoside hydrolase family 127 protein, partial [Verrucomicrobia bacterium]|nr:glycoside hydrolase family 127 protein [Verrucomicrobiota bacterium]